ncbi:hypothetical protein D9741_09130 [Escherichia sp. E14V7]|nr:hypothetical protein D9740_13760 [Escherichia sp. E14V5]RZN04287.1 hypothetical protein D9741_09130 [Escherichia sp. E14V7]RZN28924.1 hypothetical protein D9739_04690 [Escherichia sp. E14V10]
MFLFHCIAASPRTDYGLASKIKIFLNIILSPVDEGLRFTYSDDNFFLSGNFNDQFDCGASGRSRYRHGKRHAVESACRSRLV